MSKSNGRIKIEMVDISKLTCDPANTRAHSERNLETIKASLRRFGQQKPVVVDRHNVIIAGNGTLEAARALDWKKIAVAQSDLDGSDRTAYAIADNRTAELAHWDSSTLAKSLAALADDPDIDELVTGFDATEIGNLLASSSVDDNEGEWQDMPDFIQADQTSQYRIIVHFATIEDLQHFAEVIGQQIADPKNNRQAQSIWFPKAEIGRTANKIYAAGKGDAK